MHRQPLRRLSLSFVLVDPFDDSRRPDDAEEGHGDPEGEGVEEVEPGFGRFEGTVVALSVFDEAENGADLCGERGYVRKMRG
jgi:hypothetical protein